MAVFDSTVPEATPGPTATVSVKTALVTPSEAMEQEMFPPAPTAGVVQDHPAGDETETNVVFTGYLGPQYLDTLASFDALLFLVPGSDGTCRAVREAMAMGRAVIGARRGMIPEIVDDGKTGLVIDDTPENIARAIERLAADRALCRAMGAAGREKALRLYDGRHQAAAIRDIYQRILG